MTGAGSGAGKSVGASTGTGAGKSVGTATGAGVGAGANSNTAGQQPAGGPTVSVAQLLSKSATWAIIVVSFYLLSELAFSCPSPCWEGSVGTCTHQPTPFAHFLR